MRAKLIVLVALTILAGCGGSNSGIQDVDIHVGTQGLSLEFLGELPDTVYEQEVIPIPILVKNNGASDVSRGRLILSLDDTVKIAQSGKDEAITLRGKSVGNPVGDEEVYTFYVETLPLFSQTELIRSRITAIAEYPYNTDASIPVCIDTDPYNLLGRKGITKACVAESISLAGGQGAPVAVSRVVPVMKNVNDQIIQPAFDIYFQNVGGGELLSETKEKRDTIIVEGWFQEKKMVCDMGLVKEEAKEVNIEAQQRVRCIADPISRSTPPFTALINIQAYYVYRQSISYDMTIKDVSTPLVGP